MTTIGWRSLGIYRKRIIATSFRAMEWRKGKNVTWLCIGLFSFWSMNVSPLAPLIVEFSVSFLHCLWKLILIPSLDTCLKGDWVLAAQLPTGVIYNVFNLYGIKCQCVVKVTQLFLLLKFDKFCSSAFGQLVD